MFDDVLRNDFERHGHVFVVIHWGGEVKEFKVCGDVLGIFGADNTVPPDFGGDKIGSLCGKFAGVVDEITTNCDADTIGSSYWGW